ncbi:MAG: hypothetical protein HC896_09085 [Bacteroidales bacterium]|nr:hypothetical protein [Bacteroidales bacterium]
MKSLALPALAILLLFSPVMALVHKDYKPKKVPSVPVNLHDLAMEVYNELKLDDDGKIDVGGKLTFALDQFDNNIFEFLANRTLGRSGERSCQFYFLDGHMHFPRQVDYETSKNAQGSCIKT